MQAYCLSLTLSQLFCVPICQTSVVENVETKHFFVERGPSQNRNVLWNIYIAPKVSRERFPHRTWRFDPTPPPPRHYYTIVFHENPQKIFLFSFQCRMKPDLKASKVFPKWNCNCVWPSVRHQPLSFPLSHLLSNVIAPLRTKACDQPLLTFSAPIQERWGNAGERRK